MTPVQPGSYLFRKESIAEVRQRIGLSQAAMAAHIGVPQNTVSRWETGATTPDADSLAAIYSLGMKEGITVNFFVRMRRQVREKDSALVYWDAPPNLRDIGNLEQMDTFIRDVVCRRVRSANRRLFKAFLAGPNSSASGLLERLGWRVWEPEGLIFSTNWSDDIYEQALSDSGQDPTGSVVFLVTTDAGHVDTIKELKERGVHVYLMTPHISVVSTQLIEAVGRRRWIELP